MQESSLGFNECTNQPSCMSNRSVEGGMCPAGRGVPGPHRRIPLQRRMSWELFSRGDEGAGRGELIGRISVAIRGELIGRKETFGSPNGIGDIGEVE
jgi:hypothetical protein